MQSASDRIADSSGLKSLLVTSRVAGSAILLRAQGGVRSDIASHWRVGGAVRTPGATLTAVPRSPSMVCWLLATPRWALRLSIRRPSSPTTCPGSSRAVRRSCMSARSSKWTSKGTPRIPAYTMVGTSEPSVTYGDKGTNVPPSIVTQPFGGLTSASNGVVNVSAGGHVVLIKDRSLRIHGGVATSQSPVDTADSIFARADLISWTLGLSGSLAKFQFAAGLNRKSGTADDVMLRNLLSGRPVTSSIDIGALRVDLLARLPILSGAAPNNKAHEGYGEQFWT